MTPLSTTTFSVDNAVLVAFGLVAAWLPAFAWTVRARCDTAAEARRDEGGRLNLDDVDTLIGLALWVVTLVLVIVVIVYLLMTGVNA